MTKINSFFLPFPTRINRMKNLNFYIHISFCFFKRIYKGVDTKKKRENENLSWFLFWHFFSGFFLVFFEIQGTVSISKFILDNYNQLKEFDLSKKTLHVETSFRA